MIKNALIISIFLTVFAFLYEKQRQIIKYPAMQNYQKKANTQIEYNYPESSGSLYSSSRSYSGGSYSYGK